VYTPLKSYFRSLIALLEASALQHSFAALDHCRLLEESGSRADSPDFRCVWQPNDQPTQGWFGLGATQPARACFTDSC
jgi:hypothetical protein